MFDKLNRYGRILAVVAAPLLSQSCAAHFANDIRTRTLDQLGVDHEGPQEDGSYVKCTFGSDEIANLIASESFKQRSSYYNNSKPIYIEKISLEDKKVICVRVFHDWMGRLLEKNDATAMDMR